MMTERLGGVARKSLSILVLDEDPGDRRRVEDTVREAARCAGLTCLLHSFESLSNAISFIEKERTLIDAVVFGLGLPNSGFGPLRDLTIAGPTLPVVALIG